MIRQLDDISTVCAVIGPFDVRGVDAVFLFGIGRRDVIVRCSEVGDGIMMYRFGVVVFGSCEFVPCVIGFAVRVGIIADHDDTGFRRSAALCSKGSIGIESVSLNDEVILSGHIHDRMIETEDDISSPSA